jgi:L-threonylcarbamoyladenylate synthase
VETLITDSPEEAAAYLRHGELAAFPTETVYGLGAVAFDAGAVAKIFTAKGRPPTNPLIVHVADLAEVSRLAAFVSETARALMTVFFPGPLTLVLPKQSAVPDIITAGRDTVGVRMPDHTVAQAFLQAVSQPVAAPSANRSGRPSPTTWEAVYEDLNGRIPCILRGPRSDAGVESTVVDCTGDAPLLLRPGAVTLEQLQEVDPRIRIPDMDEELSARSPGTRFRHYQPNARVRLVDAPPDAPPPYSAYIGLDQPAPFAAFSRIQVCESVEVYAWELFAFFRSCDAAAIRCIYCQTVPPTRLGLALMDRLQRAASKAS